MAYESEEPPTVGQLGAENTAATYLRTDLGDLYGRPDIHERRAHLAEVVATEIVPRLIMHHGLERSRAQPQVKFSDEEIAEFGALAIIASNLEVIAYFERMRAKGHGIDTLFVRFLAPTARYLGQLWDQDRIDFVDVTIGVARLQELLTIYGNTDEIPVSDIHHHALLVTRPNEKHLFGVEMVAKIMRSSGWDVTIGKGLTIDQNVAAISATWFGVLGMTLSAESGLDEVSRAIKLLRQASRNKNIGVMVGGPAFTGHPERAVQVGADAIADDASAAVVLAKKLLLMQFARR